MTIKTIQLFVTCLIDTLQPQIGEAVVQVLERAGMQVKFPLEQTCCGQPPFNAGMRYEARKMAEHTVRVFEKDPSPVIMPSGSCAAMLRHGYPELFADDPTWLSRAQELAARTYEFTEFLVDVLGLTDLGAHFPGQATYHSSCHLLRGLGVDRQPRTLLAHVRGLELIELPYADECCGFGGLFALEMPEVSTSIMDVKLDNVTATGAETLVGYDMSCLMHLSGGLRRRGSEIEVRHIAQVIAPEDAE